MNFVLKFIQKKIACVPQWMSHTLCGCRNFRILMRKQHIIMQIRCHKSFTLTPSLLHLQKKLKNDLKISGNSCKSSQKVQKTLKKLQKLLKSSQNVREALKKLATLFERSKRFQNVRKAFKNPKSFQKAQKAYKKLKSVLDNNNYEIQYPGF